MTEERFKEIKMICEGSRCEECMFREGEVTETSWIPCSFMNTRWGEYPITVKHFERFKKLYIEYKLSKL